MALQTFTPPNGARFSVGTAESHAPRVLRNDFGDGYSQRGGDGLNADLGKLAVQITQLDWTGANAVLAFFAAHKGYLPFLFRLPGEATAKTWIAKSWTRTWISRYQVEVTADFEEVADPS